MDSLRIGSVLVLSVAVSLSGAAAPGIFLGPDATSLERDGATELQRHLYAVSGEVLPIETVETVAADATGIVLGTAASLPDVGESWPFGLTPPRDDGYVLHTIDGRLVTVAGAGPAGTQHGVFGFLEGLGFGFYLGATTYPAAIPEFTEEDVPAVHESRSPVFAVRGSLPWHGFFDSPTAWEPADYRAYIDQLVRMRSNFVGFHTYDSEPFAAYPWEGRSAGGEPLANSARSASVFFAATVSGSVLIRTATLSTIPPYSS